MATCKECEYWDRETKLKSGLTSKYYSECTYNAKIPESMFDCKPKYMYCYKGKDCPCFQKYEGE
jgi:hypothetical protein